MARDVIHDNQSELGILEGGRPNSAIKPRSSIAASQVVAFELHVIAMANEQSRALPTSVQISRTLPDVSSEERQRCPVKHVNDLFVLRACPATRRHPGESDCAFCSRAISRRTARSGRLAATPRRRLGALTGRRRWCDSRAHRRYTTVF